MNHVYLLAPAKINLYLEIVGNRPDGYHELLMLMQSIELSDLLEFRLTGIEDIRLYCQHPQVPTDQSNLIYKAVNLVKQKFPSAYNNFGGMDITLNKKIPIAAGVAGGSGNAAATLVGLKLLWRLGLTENQLKELGAQLGSDVPFSLVGGTALASGRGEKIDSLPPLENLWLVKK
jgi:4-diphosphocytidyl-2-C-methyl-D-erythritol kinase